MSTPTLASLAPIPRLRDSIKPSGMFSPGGIVLARAPGRLDVMGGIADYSGSLVCEMPIEVAAGVAVQPRSDMTIVCRSTQVGRCVSRAAGQLRVSDPLWVRRLYTDADAWARYPVGCAWWLLGHDPALAAGFRGVSILLDSDVPLGGGVSSSAAVEVATMTALAAAWNVALDPLRLAVACQEVENRVVGAPCGVMDQVTSCLGRQGSMLEILCQPGSDGLPAQVLGNLAVPPGYAFIGIHSGVSHEVSGDPYTDTRVAAFMGQKIIGILADTDPTLGHLANLTPARFDKEFARKLPERMVGREFIQKYETTNDRVTAVNPDKTYAVRAATTHPVMENDRVGRFVEGLRRGGGDDTACQLGGLMYESHKSYSDCANLGHPLTDKLVEMIRGRGPGSGFFGAKITGGGGGGTVAALIRDTPRVRAEVERLRAEYTNETGRATILFQGSSPGAAALGTAVIRYEELT